MVRAARAANEALDGWLPDAAIEIVDGRIASIGRGDGLPSDIAATHDVLDLGDVSVLPGFVETHLHMHFPAAPDYRDIARPEPVERSVIRAGAAMRDLLVSGATTARDTGSREDVALAVRSALRDGLVPGPRLLVVGAPITTTAGHYWFLGGEADTVDEVVARVRASKRAGVDGIKIMASGGGYTPTSNPRSEQYPRDTLAAAVTEAHRLGLPVLAHALTARSTRYAAEAGVDTIVHGGVWWTDHTVRGVAYAYDPAVADLIAERGIWVDPTIGEVELHREHDEAGLPPLPAFEHWALPDVPSDLEPRLGFMRDMAARGVRFIGGMGMGMPIVTFDSVACSAQAYVGLLGFDPWHAIRSITVDAAASLGLGGEVGRLRPGMAADLVSVEGDPIADPAGLAALRHVRDVIQGGRPVVRDGRPLV